MSRDENTVKIWYYSGAYEQVDRAPTPVAQAILADASENQAVAAAEVHDQGGFTTQKFTRS